MAGRMKMDKAIICKLHEITDHYLLGAGTIAPIFHIEGMVACQYLVRKPSPWDFSMSAVATGRAVGGVSGRRT